MRKFHLEMWCGAKLQPIAAQAKHQCFFKTTVRGVTLSLPIFCESDLSYVLSRQKHLHHVGHEEWTLKRRTPSSKGVTPEALRLSRTADISSSDPDPEGVYDQTITMCSDFCLGDCQGECSESHPQTLPRPELITVNLPSQSFNDLQA